MPRTEVRAIFGTPGQRIAFDPSGGVMAGTHCDPSSHFGSELRLPVDLDALTEIPHSDPHLTAVETGILIWTAFHGAVTLEVNHHLDWLPVLDLNRGAVAVLIRFPYDDETTEACQALAAGD